MLSAVFDAFQLKKFPDLLLAAGQTPPLLTTSKHDVVTSDEKSERVFAGLQKRLTRLGLKQLLYAWLSEQKDSPNLLFIYMRKLFSKANFKEDDFSDADILALHHLAKKVFKEKHRMIEFVRFQKTKDNTYFSIIAPDHNVLPLILGHFKDRFADQQWAIYDEKRNYGFYYDMKSIGEIKLDDDAPIINGKLDESSLADDEVLLQKSWQSYFKALSIKERLNPRLHRQHVPQRYWKYLTEKT